jgi:hypothetical protein
MRGRRLPPPTCIRWRRDLEVERDIRTFPENLADLLASRQRLLSTRPVICNGGMSAPQNDTHHSPLTSRDQVFGDFEGFAGFTKHRLCFRDLARSDKPHKVVSSVHLVPRTIARRRSESEAHLARPSMSSATIRAAPNITITSIERWGITPATQRSLMEPCKSPAVCRRTSLPFTTAPARTRWTIPISPARLSRAGPVYAAPPNSGRDFSGARVFADGSTTAHPRRRRGSRSSVCTPPFQ